MTINAQLEAASGEAKNLATALDELGENMIIKIAHHAPLVRSLAQRSVLSLTFSPPSRSIKIPTRLELSRR